jgi:uncharacterized protein (TIGR00369 family)
MWPEPRLALDGAGALRRALPLEMSDLPQALHELFAKSNYAQAMGFCLVAAGAGRARVETVVASTHTNTQGLCHGGVISGLMDMAAGVALKSQLDDTKRAVATVSLTVNYQRPAQLGRKLTAEATIQSGRRIVSCEISVRDDQGEAIALGVATLHVR